MPYRTTADLVKEIIDADVLTEMGCISFDGPLKAANMMVTKWCLCGENDDDALAEIERWLAAHFAFIIKPYNQMEQAGSVMQQIETKVDLGLDVTRYGQMAKRLDACGGLAAWDEQVKNPGGFRPPGVTWLGTNKRCHRRRRC